MKSKIPECSNSLVDKNEGENTFSDTTALIFIMRYFSYAIQIFKIKRGCLKIDVPLN